MLRRLLSSVLLAATLPALAAQTCPSGNVLSTPTADFTDNGDGTVTHSKTGLTWQRCAVGQTWDGSTCTGSASSVTWSAALQAAAASSFASHSDWRLPNLKELTSIVEEGCYSPSINSTLFPNDPGSWTWSSTSYAAVPAYAWNVGFVNGNANNDDKTVNSYVRLVRGGQLLGSFDQQASYTPNAYSFTNQSNAMASATMTSLGVTLAGLTTPTGIQVSGGSYAINGGSYSTAPGVVNNGDVITLRHTASASASTTVTTNVTIGGVAGSFASTTAAGDATPPTLSAVGVSGTSSSSTTLAATSDETATGYWVVLPTAASAPSATQVKAGQDGGGAAASFAGNAAMVAATAKSFTVSGLTAGTAYKLYFVARDSAGNDTTVQTVSFSTSAATAPGAPTVVSASAGNAQATVSFTAPASNGGSAILGYTVVSSPAGGVDAQADTTGTTHTITGLTNGTAYTFTVTARNSAGSSAASAASAAVTPSAPTVVVSTPEPAPTETTVSGSSALTINNSLPVRLGAGAAGAALTLNTSSPLTFTLNGADMTVQASSGSVLKVSQVTVNGKTLLALVVTQGSVQFTASEAGQVLLALGGGAVTAVSAGTRIDAGPQRLAVTSGSLNLPANSFAAADASTLYAGEVAELNAAGKVSRIRLGSAESVGTLAGDPLALTAPGLSVQTAIPRLSGAVARVPEGLVQGVASVLGGSGVQNASGTLVVSGAKPQYWLPLGEVVIDAAQADGSRRDADGLTRAAKNGVVVTLAPAPYDLARFAADLAQAVPGATLTVRENGVLVARLGQEKFVVRPAEAVNAAPAASHEADRFTSSEGVLRYRDAQGSQQALYPAFFSYTGALNLLQSLGATASVNVDGSITAQIGETRFTLSPDLALTPVDAKTFPHIMAGEKWWVEDPGRVLLNLGGGVQGIKVQ